MFKIQASEFRPDTQWTVNTGQTLEFTSSGNLELRDQFGIVVWESRTAGRGADKLAIQADGNLVIYAGARPLWATHTAKNPGAFLAILDSGVAICSADGRHLWSVIPEEAKLADGPQLQWR
jgi:hypothetical protein